MDHRNSDWIYQTEKDIEDFHKKQLRNTYRSTIKFCQWLEEKKILSNDKMSQLIDIGTGMGGNLYYLAKKFPQSSFTGIDINKELVEFGNKFLSVEKIHNAKIILQDLYELNSNQFGTIDGVISFQTLGGLRDFKLPLIKMIDLGPKWIAFTTLGFEGNINCTVEIQDYNYPVDGSPYLKRHYNIYSLIQLKQFFEQKGFDYFEFQNFDIDIDIPPENIHKMGTYTLATLNNRKLQISGPILMNWYFVLAKR